ncbi:protein Ycf2-like [Cucumis melo var. makuwa]|uniref:Protein Ycf2-like n=1 Tax=Cucumis melo var. makuwa TaxID=1194695 RepID=A0A5D3BPY3_CUCMM|nr:protein Ycf2-like [Cucumis melo var. makuwa]TYK01120.1 protein Ycf2-like [Cucumis melo var. makuwa]
MPSTSGIDVLTKMVEKIENSQKRMETSVEGMTMKTKTDESRVESLRGKDGGQFKVAKSETPSTAGDKDSSPHKAMEETDEEINRLIRSIDESVIYDEIKKKEHRRRTIIGKMSSNDRLSNMKENRPATKLNATKEGLGMKRSNAKESREVTPVLTGIWIDALRE